MAFLDKGHWEGHVPLKQLAFLPGSFFYNAWTKLFSPHRAPETLQVWQALLLPLLPSPPASAAVHLVDGNLGFYKVALPMEHSPEGL